MDTEYTRNNYTRVLFIITSVLALLSTSWHILYIVYPVRYGNQFLSISLIFLGTLALLQSVRSKNHTISLKSYNLYTVLLIVLFIFANAFIYLNEMVIVDRVGSPTQLDLVISFILVFVTLEVTRREYGNLFFILGLITLIYALFGPWFPGIFHHAGIPYARLFSTLGVPGFRGIYGRLFDLAATVIAIFIFFGLFLQHLGGVQYFSDLAKRAAGKLRSGPAQVAIISSGFMAMLSGSAIANAASTGAFTIPLMKDVGYEGEFAGAIESVSSTGGQITPPVMGAAVFIMMDYIDRSYLEIIIASIVPAIAVFITLMLVAQVRAIKEDFEKLSVEDRSVPTKSLVVRSFYLAPIVVIVASLYVGNTPMRAAWHGLSLLIMIYIAYNMVSNRNKVRETSKQIGRDIILAADEASRILAPIAILLATIGWIVEILLITGLLNKITSQLVFIFGWNAVVLLLVTGMIGIFLSLGLPTTPAYILVALIGAPPLIDFGFYDLGVHLFILYYAVLGAVTLPGAPVCLVTSSIANAGFVKTALRAMVLSFPIYVLPLAWMFYPGIILQGDIYDIFTGIIIVLLIIVCAVALFEKYLLQPLSIFESVAIIAVLLLLLYPSTLSHVLSAVIAVTVIATQIYKLIQSQSYYGMLLQDLFERVTKQFQ